MLSVSWRFVLMVCMFKIVNVGNNQKKAKALIESSGLRMLAVEDFDKAAQTVRLYCCIISLRFTLKLAMDG